MDKVLLLTASTLVGILSFSSGLRALENGQGGPLCMKSAKADGMPQRIRTLAQISAVRAWTEQVKLQGEEFAMWHNAHSGTVKCKKLDRSAFYRCTASGKPCRAMGSVEGRQAESQKR